jgi:hypothetical protein
MSDDDSDLRIELDNAIERADELQDELDDAVIENDELRDFVFRVVGELNGPEFCLRFQSLVSEAKALLSGVE